MTASILPCDHMTNNKAYSNKNNKCNVSDAGIVPIAGYRDRESKTDRFFCDIKECKNLSNKYMSLLREWCLSNPTEFGQSKKRILDTKKRGKGRSHERQNNHEKNINGNLKVNIQSVRDEVIDLRLKEIDSNNKKQVSFKLDEANVNSLLEDTIKNLSKNN